MSHLNLRLPRTLYEHLASMAASEGISLDQYVVQTSAQPTANTYTVQAIPESEIEQHQQSFQLLIEQLGKASFPRAKTVLAARKQVQPEAELDLNAVTRLRERIQQRTHDTLN